MFILFFILFFRNLLKLFYSIILYYILMLYIMIDQIDCINDMYKLHEIFINLTLKMILFYKIIFFPLNIYFFLISRDFNTILFNKSI